MSGGQPVRRSKGPRAIAQLVPGLIAPAAKRYGFSSADLLAQWTEVAGPEIAARCTPEKIAWPRRTADDDTQAPPATLHLRSPPQHALEIRHETNLIAERLNAYFGYRAIGRVVVRQTLAGPVETPPTGFGEVPQPPITSTDDDPALLGVTDAELRGALGELKRHVDAARDENRDDDPDGDDAT